RPPSAPGRLEDEKYRMGGTPLVRPRRRARLSRVGRGDPVIISRTPFRVSFVGGGTDLPEFYTRRPGAVISMAIDRYVYITVNRRFDDTLRLSYSKTEIVENLDCVAHPLFREALRLCGVHQGIEATSIADVPSGTGLGSSSSFAVGLLHALHAFRGLHRSAEDLAAQACHRELDVLHEPIGKQ